MQMHKFTSKFALAAVLLATASSCLAQEAPQMARSRRNFPGAEISQQPAPPQASPQQAAPQPQPSALPPTQPTTMPGPLSATSAGTVATSKPHHAQVTYVNGLINVRADDSSLNQILRSISRQTGLKITGGVADQRVFGNYGPATTSEIVATLLDGTNTNVLLTEGNALTAPELTLTPRNGGPTPPNPSAPDFDGDSVDDAQQHQQVQQNAVEHDQPPPPRSVPGQPQLPIAAQPVPNTQPLTTAQQLPTPQEAPPVSGPVQIPQPANNVLGSSLNSTPTASQIPTTNSVPLDAVPTPSTTTGGSGIVDSANPPPADSTTGSAPSTPQSIYQQLLQMQQKQQQQATPAATPSATPPAPQP
jgi:hypothetical protein